MPKKKTNQEFINELKEKNIEYVPLEEYINSITKIKFQCKQGHIWEATPHNILCGRGCPYCSHVAKLSNEDFVSRLKNVTNKIELLERYKSFHEKILCRCLRCGHKWMISPAKLLNGRGCPICAREIRGKNKMKIGKKNFESNLKKKKPNIILIDEYMGVDTPTRFQCKICKYEFTTTPSKLLSTEYGCRQCHHNSMKLSNIDFIDRLSKIHPNIIPVEKYDNNNVKIKYYCKQCCEYHYATPANLLSGYGCPTCNASKGEKKCKEILDNIDILYKPQFIFSDLVGIGGGNLRFDFGILNKQFNLIGLIEYDGEFHYKKMYENDGYENIQIHDKLKNDYCNINNIPLLRIPYWQYKDMEKLIYTFVSKITNLELERGA